MTGRFSIARSFIAFGLAGTLSVTGAWAQDDATVGDLTPQEQLQALIEQGQNQFNEGDFEAAATSFSTAVNALERAGAYAPGPLLLRAKAYAQLEEYEAALEDLKKALQYAQNQPAVMPEIQNTRAEVYMEFDAFQAALPDLQAAVQANRSNPQYQFNLGKALVKLGGAEPGEKALTKYLDAEVEGEEDQRAEALRLRGQAFGGMRKFAEANADIEASLAIEPDNYEAYYTRAQIALIKEDYEGAGVDLREAIAKYEPKDEDDDFPFVQGHLTLASAMEEAGKAKSREDDDAGAAAAYAACEAECEKLLALIEEDDDPRTPQTKAAALFRKGVAQRMQGELGDAVKAFSRVLEIDPNFGEAYFRRGICFHFMGEEKLAIRDFEQAASINFDSPRSNLWKGMSWAKLGEYDEAIRAYGESIAVSDRYTPAYVNRGLAHLADRDYDKAIDDFNEAIRLQPTEAMHYYRRGKAQALEGLRDKAIQSFMNAIEFNNRMGPAYNDLAIELDANGQSALAVEYRRRASQLGL